MNTNKSKGNPVSPERHKKQNEIPLQPYKNIENPLKILQSKEQSYKNYSVPSYMKMLQERGVRSNFEVDVSNLRQKEVLVSGLSTLYQSWIGKKDLSLFSSFFTFTSFKDEAHIRTNRPPRGGRSKKTIFLIPYKVRIIEAKACCASQKLI